MNESNKAHFLDLKLPLGGLLAAYGLLLGIYGLVTGKEFYAKSLGINVNLVWGILMFIVGGIFLAGSLIRGRTKS